MPRERLTSQRVDTARALNGDRLEIRDTNVQGLELRVTPRGKKSWYFHYTRLADGKRRRLLLGSYPSMGLKEARRKAIETRAVVDNRGDPAADKQALRTAMTFQQLALLRLERDNGIVASTKEQYRQAFNADIFKSIGHVPAFEVTADMVARVLDDVERRGSLVHADRVRSAIGSTFKWAVKRRQGGVTADPTTGLGKRAPAVARTRVLSDAELAKFWIAIGSSASPLTEQMQIIVKLAVLTGQRRSEVCGARYSELNLDSTLPNWIIPGDTKVAGKVLPGRTKNRQDQNLPLSQQTVRLWKKAIKLLDHDVYVFPARSFLTDTAKTTGFPHIRPDSVSQAIRRLRAIIGINDIHLHDMRRCIATWCGEQGFRPDVIDRILNHRPRDVTRRHYNFAGMDQLVLEALQSWADHVTEITGNNLVA